MVLMISFLMLASMGGTPQQASAVSPATDTGTPEPVSVKAKPVKANDPIVCETSDQIGSLIRKKRVCMRSSEWQAQRASDRLDIERGQVQVPVNAGH